MAQAASSASETAAAARAKSLTLPRLSRSAASWDRSTPCRAETSTGRASTSVSSSRERSQAFITAGNDAYKAGDFELALKRYAAAAVADPRDPAAYFGMGMTFTRLKREDEARAAYARAQQLAREEKAAAAPR